MVGFGSIHPQGGAPGSGYAPTAGFNADTLDAVDLILNEAEYLAVMMVVLQAFHPEAYRDIIKLTQAADRIGRSGTNTYRCAGYYAAQHEEADECRGMCFQTELVALPWEYAFCQPSYGYYLHTYPNMFWTFHGSRMHGTMLPATTPLPPHLRGAVADSFSDFPTLYRIQDMPELRSGDEIEATTNPQMVE
ncbi:hypothetical protein B0H14DRAFT_3730672 [Mycena olivaceomarginata]|nr:hypothetical protein B0H14DRAFT_3730672 [Mycena olivaceomarginata]